MSLKEIRKAAGLGLRQAARLAEVNPSQLSEWENARYKPDTRTLERLADFYQAQLGYPVSLDEVAGRRPFNPPTPAAS